MDVCKILDVKTQSGCWLISTQLLYKCQAGIVNYFEMVDKQNISKHCKNLAFYQMKLRSKEDGRMCNQSITIVLHQQVT